MGKVQQSTKNEAVNVKKKIASGTFGGGDESATPAVLHELEDQAMQRVNNNGPPVHEEASGGTPTKKKTVPASDDDAAIKKTTTPAILHDLETQAMQRVNNNTPRDAAILKKTDAMSTATTTGGGTTTATTPAVLHELENQAMQRVQLGNNTNNTSTPGAHRVYPGTMTSGTSHDGDTTTLSGDEEDPTPSVSRAEAEAEALDAQVVQDDEEDFEIAVQKRLANITVNPTSVAPAADNLKKKKNAPSSRSPAVTFGAIFIMGVIFLIIAIAVVFGTKEKDDNNDNNNPLVMTPGGATNAPAAMGGGVLPTNAPTTMMDANNMTKLEIAREELLAISLSSQEVLFDELSPQYQALSWLMTSSDNDDETTTISDIGTTTWIERYILAVLYYSTRGPNWYLDFQFLNTNSSACEWTLNQENGLSLGVSCNEQGSVTHLNMGANNLNGTLPEELGALSSLEVIIMPNNVNLYGPLPSSIGNLARLEELDLDRNRVSGSIPESFSRLTKLESFRMNLNALTGTIPTLVYQLPSLEFLTIGGNMLTGPIPESSSSQNDLLRIVLSYNLLTGTIPESICKPTINLLYVWGNLLTGSLPSNIDTMVELQKLNTHGNHLNGTLPSELGTLINLEALILSSNSFSGSIPSEMALLTRLDGLLLNDNQLTGTLPESFGNFADSGIKFSTHFNNLTGSFDMFCNNETTLLAGLETDCGGPNPQIDCPCCATCCDREARECAVNHHAVCMIDRTRFEDESGDMYHESRGTECECIGEGSNTTLSCRDTTCQSCNRDNTVCSVNQDYSYQYYEEEAVWKTNYDTFQYVVGRNETVVFEQFILPDRTRQCVVYVNGNQCNSCETQRCADGWQGFQVNCENVGAGVVDLCDDEADDQGPLTIFALQDPALRNGCAPRLIRI